MAIPAGEIGIGAVSGGALVGFIIKVLPVLLKKMNGSKSNTNSNCKPGKASVCIERGEKLAKHDVILEHLDKAMDENRKDHKLMLDKLDWLK